MAGKYKAYPEYKNSENPWLGDVPKDWNLIQLKYLSRFSGGGTPSKDNPEYWNGDIPWVSPKDMKTSRIISTIDNITEKAIKQSSTSLLNKGALLVVVRSGILQHSIPVAINDVPVTLNQDMKALQLNSKLNAKYAMYLIVGSQTALLLEWRKQGATVESIEQEYLANTIFPVPGLNEQEKIIKFLDCETSKIDTLIEKQQQLIQLLKEKRQAGISHAVTKGLNPNAKLRDSGVEWLGEVPEGWDVLMVGKATRVYRGKFTHRPRNDPRFYDGDYPFIQTGDIANSEVTIKSYTQTLNDEGVKISQKFPAGTLMMGIVGAKLGSTAILEFESYGPDSIVGFHPGAELDINYLRYIFMASIQILESTATQSAQPNLNIERISAMYFCRPSLEEQKKIVSYLAVTERSINIAEKKIIEAISLMQERRTALISAAVTGKIDVRGWVALESSLTDKEVAA
ncbi:restriction endonuclease subunit S [Pseudomonas protegens]|uniref:restriction endonuclease subunit S n=2 Tax=Bacteria TaxID=2 RepID=UPI001C8E4BDB|nr:restriction endonuclease subunit S [Pseudomonas protegens]QZI69337.1 restriction endonuclease subunit S [Pseudomonas protegens]